jgi:hypothetical protein
VLQVYKVPFYVSSPTPDLAIVANNSNAAYSRSVIVSCQRQLWAASNPINTPPKTAQPSVSKVIPIKGGLLMRILSALVAGFLSSPPPKAALVTLVWLGGRSHPGITLMAPIAILAAWRQPND